MRPDLTIVLDEALERLRAGATVEECLRAYPEHAADLEPMLRTAAAIRRQAVAALPPSLEQWLASGRSEIEQIARATYTRRETATQRFMRQASAYVTRLLKRSGPRMASAAITVVVILFMTFYTVDGAAARSLPGDYLYRWKLFSEQARIAMTVDPDRRAQLVAASVERRVAEIAALTKSGQASPRLIAETVAQLGSQVDQALTALPEASSATNERTTAYLSRLLARAEADLREASAPDQGDALVIETAAANVAGMIDVLPAQADAQRPPTAEAAAPPAGDTTPAPTSQPSQSQSAPSAPTAPPIVIVGPPAGGGIPAPVPTPEPGILQNTPAPTPTPTPNEGGQVVIIPAPPTFTPAAPTPTFTPQPTRTPQATRTPVITSAPPVEPSATNRSAQPQTPTATFPVISSPTPEATATDEPTATATNTPTSTPTPTDEPTATATRTPTRTPTSTPSDTPTPTDTATPTSTPTDTATPTSTPTDTATPSPTATDTATPSPTATTIGDDPISGALRPLLECVDAQPDGTYLAVFGYRNNTGDMAIAEIGIDNYFYPGLIDRGQPTVFTPGRSRPFPNVYFSVAFDGNPLTWVLGRHEVTATRDTRACPAPTPTTNLAP